MDHMNTTQTTNRASRRMMKPLAAALIAGAALVGAACVPDPAPGTTTTTTEATTTTVADPGCVGVPATATNGAATVTVSKVTCLEVGDEITVTGTGFTTTGNIGTRPPFSGQPSGNYVVWGKFADVWQPSLGTAVAPGSTRTIISQKWPIPEPTFTASGGALPYVLLEADGSFTTTVTIAENTSSANPNYGFAVYGGSGATNAAEEFFFPGSFAPVEAD